MQTILKKSFLKACFEITGIYFWISLFLFVTNFTNNILIITTLYEIFNYKQLNIKFAVILLLVLIASRFFLSYLNLIIERKIRKIFCTKLTEYFNFSRWKPSNKSLISKIISRDIPILLETVSTIPKLFYYPICIVIGFTIIYKLIGINGIVAISSVILFIPISFFISKKSILLAIKIYDISKLRLEEVSRWIEWRPIVFNWAESNNLIKRTAKLTETELHLRTLDSMWRSLDLYIITFGRCLPVTILILISMLFKNDISNSLLLTIWLSVPFISLIMEAGRFGADFKLSNKAFCELQQASEPLSKISKADLILDDNWEIWDGTLAENCLTNQDNTGLSLLVKLRLAQELGDNYNEVYLSRFGKNISEGQKTRILLIRAIHLAISSDKTLRICRTLNSLDPEVCKSLSNILNDPIFVNRVILSKSCNDFIEDQLLRFDSTRPIYDKSIITDKTDEAQIVKPHYQTRNILRYLIEIFNPLSIAFIFPAICLSLVGYIAIANFTLATKLFSILGLSIFSIILAVFLGVKNETHTRKWALARLIDILLNSSMKNSIDIYQRLSQDFSTVVERISWYLHDITWLVSLLFVSISAIIISFRMVGVLISAIFLLLSYGIWKIFENKIKTARIISISAINQMLTMGENLVCYGDLTDSIYLTKKRTDHIQSTLNNFYQSNSKLITLKIIFSNLFMCVSGLLILATLMGSSYHWISLESLVFILTAILAVDASIGMLFQALSGFNAQKISIHRLIDFEKEQANLSHGLLEKINDNYVFNGEFNPNTHVNYFPMTFNAGTSYSMIGTSGIGKTQFLKIISGLGGNTKQKLHSAQCHASILYIDKNSYIINSWLQDKSTDYIEWDKDNFIHFIKEKIFNDKFEVVVLDEALINFNTAMAIEIVTHIQAYILHTHGLLLFVDHRFTLDKSISISKVQSSINIL